MKPDRRFERSDDRSEPSPNRWPFSRELDEEDDILLKKKKDTSKEAEKKPGGKSEVKDEKEATPDKKTEEDKKQEKEKKDKRTEIIERSQTLTKQYEDEPAPSDPETLTRLIVAERIVTLDRQLKHPEKDTVHTPAELEEALDYMCLLAEKLEEPEIESLPEVEEVYEELIELTEAALEKGDDPNEIILNIDEQLQELLQTPDEEAELPNQNPSIEATQTAIAKGAKAAAIAAVFAKIIRPRSTPEFASSTQPITSPELTPSLRSVQPEAQHTPTRYEEMPGGSYTETTLQTPAERHRRMEVEALYRPAAHNASEYHVTTSGRNHIHPLASIAIASVIAAKLHRGPETSVAHSRLEVDRPETPLLSKTEPQHTVSPNQTVSEIAPQTVEPTPIVSYSEQETPLHTPIPASSHLRMNTEPRHEIPAKSLDIIHRETDRKLEHMTTQSLLTLAHGVHLGYGQYLKEEFEKGAIDKDGLIKVLKARAKGKDFSREFREQAAHYRLLKSSPEFLREDRLRMALPPVIQHAKTPIQDVTQPQNPSTAAVTPTESALPQPSSPQGATSPTAETHEQVLREDTPEKSDANSLWIISIIIGVVILALLLWTLLR